MTKKSKRNKLPKTMNQKQAKKLLKRNGWEETPGGKHQVKMIKKGCRPVTLPQHRNQQYAPGYTKAILQEAGLMGADDGDDT